MSSGKPAIPRGCTAVPAFDPKFVQPRTFFLRNSRMDHAHSCGPGASYELAYTVRNTLKDPTAIFCGLREESDMSGLCYCATPERAYDFHGNIRKPWPNEVFLVFICGDGFIYHWLWEKCCPDNPDLPLKHSTRFEARLL